METDIVYHPDPMINEAIRIETLDNEVNDLSNGYPPRHWCCPQCRRSHGRGHFLALGQHRCLWCGYVGTGGVMWDPNCETDPASGEENCTPAACV